MSAFRTPSGKQTATHLLWKRLRTPYDFAEVIGAAFGLDLDRANALEALLLAASTEADVLLGAMPSIGRSLASSHEPAILRCVGEIRGPILWSETMAAWGASGGHEDVMVCAVPQRSYDRVENQLLRAALGLIARANRALAPLVDQDDIQVADLVEVALSNAWVAQEFYEDARLLPLRPRRIGLRELHRVRFGPHGRIYEPARLVYQRHIEGSPLETVLSLLGEQSIAYHEKLVAIAEEIEAEGMLVRPFKARNGVLSSGTLEFRHPALWGESDWCGIRRDGVVVA